MQVLKISAHIVALPLLKLRDTAQFLHVISRSLLNLLLQVNTLALQRLKDETGLCLLVHLEPTQMDEVERASLCLRKQRIDIFVVAS